MTDESRTLSLPEPHLWVILGLLAIAALTIALAPLPLAVAALAGAILALAVLIRPWLGLPLLALALPFAAIAPLPVGGGRVDGADLLLALVIAGWLAQGVARRRIVLPRAPLTLPLLGLIGASLLSLLGAQSYEEGLPELIKWLQVLLLYWCVAAILPREQAGWLLAGLILAGVAQALLGIYQFLTQSGPEAFVLLGRFMRASGTFRQPNPYAGYLGLIAPVAASLAIWAWWPGRLGTLVTRHGTLSRTALRLALLAAAIIVTLGIVVSWSRGAWIAYAVAVGAVVLALSRRAAPAVLIAGVIVMLAALFLGAADLLPPSIAGRLSDLQGYVGLVDVRRVEVNDANFSVIERVAHWEAAIAMWADRPWLGVGAGNYAVAYPAYALPRWQEALGHAHNVYLNAGAETGLLGLLAYLLFWVAAIGQAIKAAAADNRLRAAVGAGVLGALAHATIHNLFDNLWVQHIYLILALLLGLLVVLARPQLPGDTA